MFKKLRKRFTLVTMLAVTLVLSGILGIINLVYYFQESKEADRVLNFLEENNGTLPEEYFNYGDKKSDFSIETPYTTRYFTVNVNNITGVTSINMGHVAAIQPSEAYNYALAVADIGKKTGIYKDYKYEISTTKNGYNIIFLDWEDSLDGIYKLIVASFFILIISLLIIYVLIWLLSKPLVEPIIRNIERQKRFITDASHEIKTPLSIILADTDVLEIIHGPDEWTEGIKEQVHRLSDLIKGMLTLAKMENVEPTSQFSKFNLSDSIHKVANGFNSIALSEGKTFNQSISDDLIINGNEESIDQLVSVLLNNAFKYSKDDGLIDLRVYKKGKNIVIDCINSTNSMPEGDLNRLFDRFYRSDDSRSRETGSYGIGLSIAKAAVEQHKGSITAQKLNDNVIMFRSIISSN